MLTGLAKSGFRRSCLLLQNAACCFLPLPFQPPADAFDDIPNQRLRFGRARVIDPAAAE